jgi:Cu2+-exporting ATPase
MDAEHVRFLRWVSMLLTVPIVLGPGSVFFRGAVAALRMRSLHMDVPVAIALAAGFTRGAANTISGTGPIYFDGVATLVFLLLLGRWLQMRAQRSAADASELMHALAPVTARRIETGADGVEMTREVPVEALLPGTIVEIKDSETMPADGTVASGHSFADVSFLTGESRPVAIGPGDRVFAGAVNRGGMLRVSVEQTGEESRLGRILADIGSGALRRAPVVQLADRWSGVFVAVVLALAAATIGIWWQIDAGAAIDHGIALLIVTCPCALALATPLAVTVAIGRAARAGILIKGGDALEHLARPSLMLLDKTGTVTAGRSRLVDWQGPEWVKPVVLGLERHSSHPLAAGFAEAWPGFEPAAVEAIRSVPGAGVEGVVGGKSVFVGAPWQVARDGPSDRRNDHPTWTPVVVAVDGQVVARASFADAVRPDASRAIEQLRHRGWTIELLSGDEPRTVAAVAAEVGIAPEHARGAASPEDKRAVVERRLKDGPAIMVGDGINDAPAMAIATVGIGVSGGAEACLATADVHLARPGLGTLVELVEGSRRTMHVIHRNIAFSVAYNLVGAGLAMIGWMNPLLAAVLMPISSLTVVLSSRWSRTFDPGTVTTKAERVPAPPERWVGSAPEAVPAEA